MEADMMVLILPASGPVMRPVATPWFCTNHVKGLNRNGRQKPANHPPVGNTIIDTIYGLFNVPKLPAHLNSMGDSEDYMKLRNLLILSKKDDAIRCQ